MEKSLLRCDSLTARSSARLRNVTLLLCHSLLLACGKPVVAPTIELHGQTMGTSYTVTLFTPTEALDLDTLRTQIQMRLDDIEDIASTYDASAELATLNRAQSADWQVISSELCQLFLQAIRISELTDGAFDVTVGAAVNAWGFGTDASVEQLPSDESVQVLRESIDYRQLTIDCDTNQLRKNHVDALLDLSAFAKGYAVDEIVELLAARSLDNFLVEIGGEVRGQGRHPHGKPFMIGIESPDLDNPQATYVIQLVNRAIATSGDYRNFIEQAGDRFSHTINPLTARPVPQGLAAVSVIAEHAATADALATALLVMGPDNAHQFAVEHDLAVLFVIREAENFRHQSTSGFQALLSGH